MPAPIGTSRSTHLPKPGPGFALEATDSMFAPRHTFPICGGGSEVLHKWRAIEEVVSPGRKGGFGCARQRRQCAASVSDAADDPCVRARLSTTESGEAEPRSREQAEL